MSGIAGLMIANVEAPDARALETSGLALIANAAICTYLELRAGISGVNFAAASDRAPPLHLYRRFGTGFAKSPRGIESRRWPGA